MLENYFQSFSSLGNLAPINHHCGFKIYFFFLPVQNLFRIAQDVFPPTLFDVVESTERSG